MATISDIKPQSKSKNRMNVFLDGNYFCALQVESIIKYKLKPQMQIDISILENIQRESDLSAAKEYALSLLERKLYTVSEISKKLTQRGYLPQTIVDIVAFLTEYSFVNDKNYVKCFIDSNKNRSKKDIEYKLRAKGISVQTIREELENSSDFDELNACDYWAKKFAKNKSGIDNFQQKLFAHLVTKGFSFDIAKSTAKKYSGGIEDYD